MSRTLGRDDWVERARALGLPSGDWRDAELIIQCWLTWHGFVPREVRRRALRYAQHYEPVMFDPGSRAARIATAAFADTPPQIVNSEWLVQSLKLDPADARPHKVFPGVDTATFFPAARPRKSDQRLRVVALGRRDPWKGLEDLFAALELQGAPSVDLVTFGGPVAVRQSTSWGSLEELGLLTAARLAELYRQADVVVTPSWYESFPLPPLEAMSCNRAVITTRVGTEDFAVDDTNCLVVEPKDPSGIRDALAKMADPRLRDRLAAAGRETAESFTWDRGFEQFLVAVGLTK